MNEILAEQCDLDFEKCFKQDTYKLLSKKMFEPFNALVIQQKSLSKNDILQSLSSETDHFNSFVNKTYEKLGKTAEDKNTYSADEPSQSPLLTPLKDNPSPSPPEM